MVNGHSSSALTLKMNKNSNRNQNVIMNMKRMRRRWIRNKREMRPIWVSAPLIAVGLKIIALLFLFNLHTKWYILKNTKTNKHVNTLTISVLMSMKTEFEDDLNVRPQGFWSVKIACIFFPFYIILLIIPNKLNVKICSNPCNCISKLFKFYWWH